MSKETKSEIISFESPELKLVEPSKAKQIKETFYPMVEMLEGFESQYLDIIKERENGVTPELSVKAKRLRLDVAQIRIKTGNLKDESKEKIKIEDRAIMAVHNIVVWAVSEKESELKKIENHAEILEKQRLEKLQLDRVKEICEYIEDAEHRVFSDMDEDVWSAFLGAKKKSFEDRIAAEKQAESDRIEKEKADAADREAQRLENIRLKQESEKRDKAIEAERVLREKAEKERLEKERVESEKRELSAKKERELHQEQLRIEAEKREKIEREEKEKREKIEKELQAKKDAEAKALADADAAKQAELSKGDEAKFQDLLNDLVALKTKYTFKSAKNVKMYQDVSALIDKVINHIKK